MPMRFFDISSRASEKPALCGTEGTSSPVRITSRTCVSRRRPSAPPGCERAKSSAPKPLASSSATASASPRASAAVVLAVGARFSGQASLSTRASRCTSASRASAEFGIAGDRDEARALAFQQRHDGEQFLAFAGVGQRDQHVVARDHADIAVARLGRMHEIGRRAGARHGGSDLARDMAGFADAAHHHAALAVEQQRDGVEKALAQPRSEALDGFGFDGEHLLCQLQRGLGR